MDNIVFRIKLNPEFYNLKKVNYLNCGLNWNNSRGTIYCIPNKNHQNILTPVTIHVGYARIKYVTLTICKGKYKYD